MPIYEYRCSKCGDFDVMQKITDKPLRRCPTCKGKVAKLMSSTAFQLKGTGWYVTDYANKGKPAGSDEAKSGDTGSSTSTSEPAKGAAGASPTTAEKPSKAKGKGAGKSSGSGASASAD